MSAKGGSASEEDYEGSVDTIDRRSSMQSLPG